MKENGGRFADSIDGRRESKVDRMIRSGIERIEVDIVTLVPKVVNKSVEVAE